MVTPNEFDNLYMGIDPIEVEIDADIKKRHGYSHGKKQF